MSDLRKLADAVMYEGFMLWPYTPSALKNQRRWTFGCVFPAAWTALHPDDAALMRTQVLVESDPHEVEVTVRFLQEGVERSVGRGPFAFDGVAGDVDVVVAGDRLTVTIRNTTPWAGEDGALQTTRLSWRSEAAYDLPVAVWKETMERYFRGTAWVRLSKESFDRLSAYKSRNALASWDDALASLGL